MAYTVVSATQQCNEDKATLGEVDAMLKGIQRVDLHIFKGVCLRWTGFPW